MSAAFWNGIIADHAASHLRVTELVTLAPDSPPAKTYRGWSITWDYGEFSATNPNYDASYEGPEDGWVDNGQRVFARTIEDLETEVDAWLEEHSA